MLVFPKSFKIGYLMLKARSSEFIVVLELSVGSVEAMLLRCCAMTQSSDSESDYLVLFSE